MRRLVGQAVAGSLSLSRVVSAHVYKIKQTQLVSSIYFHNPTAHVFAGTVDWLLQQGFQPISTAELQAAIYDEVPLPPQPLHISLDDACSGNLTQVVPVAETLRLPITIFVPTEPVECGDYWWTAIERHAGDNGRTGEMLKSLPDQQRRQYLQDVLPAQTDSRRVAMTKNELRSVARSKFVTIGSHTVTHPILTKCSADKLCEEVQQSKAILEGWTDKEVTVLAYPNGTFGAREIAAVRRADYRLAFTTIQANYSPWNVDAFAMPRYAMLDEGSVRENICRSTGAWRWVPTGQQVDHVKRSTRLAIDTLRKRLTPARP